MATSSLCLTKEDVIKVKDKNIIKEKEDVIKVKDKNIIKEKKFTLGHLIDFQRCLKKFEKKIRSLNELEIMFEIIC